MLGLTELLQPSDAGNQWHARDAGDALRGLNTSASGLTSEEARRRLRLYGPNEIEGERPAPAWAVLLRQLRSPLIYILLGAVVVTLALGEFIDAGVIAAVLALNTTIGFVQERRAEASVLALAKLASPQARVLRDGRDMVIPSRELVPGDVVLLESGMRVPADLRLLSVTALMTDESLLTGESLPVAKGVEPVASNAPLADRSCMAYAGTVVVSGRGRGVVVATGLATAVGGIAEAIRTAERPETPLQRRMNSFARVVGVLVGAGAAATFALGIALGEPPSHMFSVAVALAVAAVPEGLPVVFTITLALGVRRMARRNAIVRRLPAVETLGSTTVIATDKTGTLTENRMVVRAVWSAGELRRLEPAQVAPPPAEPPALPEPLRMTLMAGVLTNEAEVEFRPDGYDATGDPTEVALLLSAAAFGLDPEALREAWDVEVEVPFEPVRQYSAALRRNGSERFVFVKGAPERVIERCTHLLTEDGPAPLDRERVLEEARRLAGEGLRVLAMAIRPVVGSSAVLESELGGLTLAGLQAMQDPPRPGVREAIAGCRRAGIRVMMVTGDHAGTAEAIAAEVGIGGPSPTVVTGAQLARMSEQELEEVVGRADVFARVAPDEKLRIVQALRRRQEVVAVTGDGVNDAPALRAADIGVAMGRSGTDVAREAADIVLADDNFVTIFAAVREGRVTFDNIRKVTYFLISTGAASLVTLPAALILGWPVPFVAAQLIWLNLVTNGLQDVALAFEPGDPDVLDRPPRPTREGIISPVLWERTFFVGLVMAAGTLALFRWELDRPDTTLAEARTVALTVLVLFQVFHVGNSRSEWQSVFLRNPLSNPFLFYATAAAVGIHVAAIYAPPTQYVLRVEPIDAGAWSRIVVTAASVIAVSELHKLLRGPRRRGVTGASHLGPFGPVSGTERR
ncbi:putative cation-transporting ATPase F [bacterium HR29]|nr:putative cation-transporting ATPase F [bacterium HR29]